MASLLPTLLDVCEDDFHKWPLEKRQLLMSALYDALCRDESIQLRLVELLTNHKEERKESTGGQTVEGQAINSKAQEAANIVRASLRELYDELAEKMKKSCEIVP